MGTKDNEGDNPTNERLIKSVNDYVMEIMRLDYAGTSEEMNVEPQLVTDNYNYIKQFPESKLTPDSVGTVYKDINTFYRHSLNSLSKEEIIDATCKTFLTSVKLLKSAMYSLDEVVSTKKLEEQLRQCKNELDEHRVNVIELQRKLIKNQEEQLSSMTNSVQKVKAYSTVLAQNVAAVSPVVRKSAQNPTPSPSSERDKNLVIFGIPETTDRLTKNSVDALFDELKERPKVNAMKRIGERNDKGPRPLLISFERRATLIALLKKSRQLKNSEHYSAVYLSPDLTPIQIRERKVLINTMKKLRLEDPGGKYYIKNNIIQVG
jgi:hypothetical protein